jgi:hypothetical protein
LVAAPFGHRRPREIGLSTSPSICTMRSSWTYTRCPHPTAQNGQTERTTRSALAVRGRSSRCGAERAASPRAEWSSVMSWRSTGHEVSRRSHCTADGYPFRSGRSRVLPRPAGDESRRRRFGRAMSELSSSRTRPGHELGGNRLIRRSGRESSRQVRRSRPGSGDAARLSRPCEGAPEDPSAPSTSRSSGRLS